MGDFRPRDLHYPDGLLGGATGAVPQFTSIDGRNIDVVGGEDLGAYQSNAHTYFIPGRIFPQASTPIPPHTTTSARADLDLMFLGGQAAMYHDVYLSMDPCLAWFAQPGSKEHLMQLQAPRNIVPPGPLQEAAWYYWRVDTVVEGGKVLHGPLWCFAVGAGEGGCSQPPCSDPLGTIGTNCATDTGSEEPGAPKGCTASSTSSLTTSTLTTTTTTTRSLHAT